MTSPVSVGGASITKRKRTFLGGHEAVVVGEVLDVVGDLGASEDGRVAVDAVDGVEEGILDGRLVAVVEQATCKVCKPARCNDLS